MRKNVIKITLGPQFNQGRSASLLVLLLFLFALDIILYVYPIYFAAFLLSIYIILIVYKILDIQGVEIDKENSLVRNYKLQFWGKSGKWIDLINYHSIYLDYTTYHIKSSSSFNEFITTNVNYRSNKLHGHFLIFLIHKNENKSILLGEKSNYDEAKMLALKYSEIIGIPFRNIIREKIQKSKLKRSNQ